MFDWRQCIAIDVSTKGRPGSDSVNCSFCALEIESYNINQRTSHLIMY